MKNLLGQSDAVTVFDTSVKATKSAADGKEKNPVQNPDKGNTLPSGDIITGIWRNDRLEDERQTGVFEGGRITNGRFQSVRPKIAEKMRLAKSYREYSTWTRMETVISTQETISLDGTGNMNSAAIMRARMCFSMVAPWN